MLSNKNKFLTHSLHTTHLFSPFHLFVLLSIYSLLPLLGNAITLQSKEIFDETLAPRGHTQKNNFFKGKFKTLFKATFGRHQTASPV